MTRLFFILGAFSAFIGVALGAFAAHILKNKLTAEMLSVFEVGVRYQIYHAFALFAVAWASSYWQNINFYWAGWLFSVGTILFSGSLYLLSLTGIRWFGLVTPIGGLMFLWGWFVLIWVLWRSKP